MSLLEDVWTSLTTQSDWDGKTLRLKRPKNEQAYASALDYPGENFLAFALMSGEHCEWQRIPRMLVRAQAEGDRYPYARDAELSFWDERRLEGYSRASNCGSIRDFLKLKPRADAEP